MTVKSSLTASTTADIRAAIRQGRDEDARVMSLALLSDVMGQPVADLTINADRYSLNSVNGFAEMENGKAVFFKFHQEDGEEDGVDEYYNAQALARAGYPVSRPLFQETAPGRQMLVYARSADPRLSDVCSSIEKGRGQIKAASVIAAQTATDKAFATIARRTLHWSEDPSALRQPLFQLFYNRLVDDPARQDGVVLGGRVRKFYLGQPVTWPGLSANFNDIRDLSWEIDGLTYGMTLRDGFRQALRLLSPKRFLPGPVVTAHGDAHNANVWYHPHRKDAPLSLFDPAFAGCAVPALLAEVKATFHNVFAHPFWLYEPDIAAEKFSASVSIEDGRIRVVTNFRPSPLREAFAASKARHFWAPLLADMARRGWLDAGWETTVRTALFACPTLVMNLLPGPDSTHNPTSSLLGFSQAMRVLCPPGNGGQDFVSTFFDCIRGANDWD